MPFPNSQSPVTLKLSQLFTDPAALPAFNGQTAAAAMLDFNNTSGELAVFYGAANASSEQHVNDWPIVQQRLVRRILARAITEDRPVSFDWQTGTSTRVDIIDFGTGQPIGITFRSPLAYPPYTGS